MRVIDSIIIHYSASQNPDHNDVSVIRKWHVEERNFVDVGYHYFIKSCGEIQDGRPLEQVGAHAFGKNQHSVGICLHGNGEHSKEQLLSLLELIKELCFYFNITFKQVKLHKEIGSTSCCSGDIEDFIKQQRSLTWQKKVLLISKVKTTKP